MNNTHHCQEPHCTCQEIDAYEAYNMLTQRYDMLYLCDQHATAYGFCLGCGHLVAGDWWHERSLSRVGLCADCLSDLQAETGEDIA
jgi:hypothetical protein